MCLISFWECWGNPSYIFLTSFTWERSYTGPSNTFTTNHCLPDRLAYPKPFQLKKKKKDPGISGDVFCLPIIRLCNLISCAWSRAQVAVNGLTLGCFQNQAMCF